MKKLFLFLGVLTVSGQLSTKSYESTDNKKEDRKYVQRHKDRQNKRHDRMKDEGFVGNVVEGSVGLVDDVSVGAVHAVDTVLTGGHSHTKAQHKKQEREAKYSNKTERKHRWDYRNDGFRKNKKVEGKEKTDKKDDTKKTDKKHAKKEHTKKDKKGTEVKTK